MLLNGTYQQHSVAESSAVFTSYNGIFRIEVSSVRYYCISLITYQLLLESYDCIGKICL